MAIRVTAGSNSRKEAPVMETAFDGVPDLFPVVADVKDVAASQSPLLSTADVYARTVEGGRFFDAAGGVADASGSYTQDSVVEIAPQAGHQTGSSRMVGSKMPQRGKHSSSPSVVVGIGHDDLAIPVTDCIAQHCQCRANLPLCPFSLGGHGMLREEQHRPPRVQFKTSIDLGRRRERALRDQVERRQSHVMDPPWFLSETAHPFGGLLIGREVEVGQFGDRMAHRIVQRAPLGVIAAFYMGNGYGQLAPCDCRRESLETVAVDKKEVRTQSRQETAETDDALADRLRGREKCVARLTNRDSRVDAEPVAAYFPDGVAKVGLQVCAGNDQIVPQFRSRSYRPDHRVEQAVVRTIAGVDCNPTFHVCVECRYSISPHRSWLFLGILTRAVRPRRVS
jgi:hypothetical protein